LTGTGLFAASNTTPSACPQFIIPGGALPSIGRSFIYYIEMRCALTIPDNGKAPKDIVAPPSVQSEDCLRLNVYAPTGGMANKAVMVFIHGGGFQIGWIGTAIQNGTNLAAHQDVIVVLANYRLGGINPLQRQAKCVELTANEVR
jgi:acetyl esterase/lipase